MGEEDGQPHGPAGQPQGTAPTRLDCAVPDVIPAMVALGLGALALVCALGWLVYAAH